MIHAATVDEQLFCRALAIINAPWISAVEEGLTAATGRPRVHSPRTVLGLLAITALEREGEIVFAKAARVTRRLNPWQKHRLGLVCPIDGKQVSRTLKEIARGLVSQVDPRTGEVRPPRIATGPTDLFTAIVAGVIPDRIKPTSTQAIDSTDVEVNARRRSYNSDGKADVDKDALPDTDFRPVSHRHREPGWPKEGADGRAQNSVDPQARDGYRAGKNAAPKGVFVGYDAHISVDVAGCGDRYAPSLIRGLSLQPAGSSKTDAGIDLIDALIKAGVPIEEVLVDRGYSYGTNQNWADRLCGRDIEQVFDLHSNQKRVRPGPDPRMIYIDGQLFTAAIPTHLKKLPAFAIGMTVEEKAALTKRYDERSRWGFKQMGGPDLARRTQRYRGPALAGTVRCPNVPESMELSVDNRPLTDCVEGADCGCGATITLGPDDELGTRQRTIYGTRAWAESYGRRNAVESANALIKVHYAQLCRGSIRALGQLTHGLLVSIILSTVNIALLDTIYGIDAGKPLPDDAPITAREPRTQALHRKPRAFQRPARTPKAQPMNDGPSTNTGDWIAVK